MCSTTATLYRAITALQPMSKPITHVEFWDLVEDSQISAFKLAQIVSAPIKVLLEWYDDESVPVEALKTLKKHLGCSSGNP